MIETCSHVHRSPLVLSPKHFIQLWYFYLSKDVVMEVTQKMNLSQRYVLPSASNLISYICKEFFNVFYMLSFACTLNYYYITAKKIEFPYPVCRLLKGSPIIMMNSLPVKYIHFLAICKSQKVGSTTPSAK